MAMRKVNNPFNPGEGVIPPYLAGRKEEVDAFTHMAERIHNGQAENILVHGLRGVGKTTLMMTFSRMCIDNGLLPITKALFTKKHSDPTEFAQMLKHSVKTGIETFSRLEHTQQKFLASAKLIRPKNAGVPGLVYYEPSYDPGDSVPYEEHLKNYLVKNWEIIEKSEYGGAVLLFDEFHTVRDVPKRSWHVMSDFLGVLADVQAQGCGYFAVLSGLPTLKSCVYDARSYSERMFRLLGVGNLCLEYAQKALAEPLRGSRYSFSPELIEQVARDTGGHPHFLQFFGSEIISNARRSRITLDDYLQIKGAIMARLDADFYDPQFDALTCSQKKVLVAMSKVDGDDASLSVLESTVGISKASLVRHLVRLEEKGMVYRHSHGMYRFSLPLVREYLRRRDSMG